MKRFFLIPLMALCTCVMAWGTEIVVNDFATLKTQLSASGTADVVKLGQDIAYATNGSDLLNIERSLTLDGQGHKIVGWGTGNFNHDGAGREFYSLTPLAINHGEIGANLDVTLQGLTMSTVSNSVKKQEIGLYVSDGVDKLTIIDCDIRSHSTSGNNAYGIAFYAETTVPMELVMRNCFVSAAKDGYGLTVLRPIDANIQNSTLEGYSATTFYAPNSELYPEFKTAKVCGNANSGSGGSTFYAKNCDFNAPNVHNGLSNAYGSIVIQDGGVDVTLENCGINAEQIGDQKQWCVMISPWTPVSRRHLNVNVEFKGDNSHVNGTLLYVRWLEVQSDKTYGYPEFKNESWAYWGENGISLAGVDHSATRAFTYTGNINITVSGGTYAQNVGDMAFPMHVNTSHPSYSSTAFVDADLSETQPEKFIMKDVVIPEGYEVKEITMEGVATPLYRVVKKAAVNPETSTLYDLNDAVETAAEGENPVTSFELSTGTEMKLDEEREVTTAGYVQVKDNGSSQATVVKVGTTATADPTQKVDQTLVINNGLDVQGDSKVEVQAGSALVIGEGGIVTSKPENIVINADEEGAATLLLDPTITVNQTPELTVKMLAKNVGRIGDDYFWHRFALPVDQVKAGDGSWAKDGHSYGTLLYRWDYVNNKWTSLSSLEEMQPFYGYTMSLEETVANPGELKDAGYIFKGNLTGNVNSTLDFSRQGYNYFGNSYTGYISVLKLIDQLLGNGDIDGTVWMWNTEEQQFEDVPLNDLKNNPTAARFNGSNSWKKEVAPMQTFILRLMSENTDATAEINYANAVWGNPRYDAATGRTSAPAPARHMESTNDAYVRIVIAAANGKKDAVKFYEDANLSDAYDKGFDGAKYMNENSINVYATVNGENFGTVATDNMEGKSVTIRTNNEIAYTMTFADVEGNKYAVKDNVTNQIIAIEEGATYEFAAQPNSTIEGRFVIMPIAKVPTAIESAEAVKANVKGIYTIMGQYLGEDFNVLPAGVYVVDGVKIVK